MLNFQDSLVSRLSEEQFVRIQLENLMEVMVNKVQDQVCNELGALSCEPVGLGTRLIEKPVWGIDSHTVKTIQLILEDYYWRNIRPSAYASASSSAQGTGTAETAPALAPPSAPDRFTIEEYKKFLERTLLPTINSVPTPSAHSMKYVLETIIEVSSLPPSLLSSALLCYVFPLLRLICLPFLYISARPYLYRALLNVQSCIRNTLNSSSQHFQK
jgi:hypothetical protein